MEMNIPKTGYVNSDFRIFYLKDCGAEKISNHYHDFHKILFFLNGNVSYNVEGRFYELKPNDIILIRAGEIHRPVIHDASSYERLIVYLSPEYLASFRERGCSLDMIFTAPKNETSNLVRPSEATWSRIAPLCRELTVAVSEDAYGSELYQESLLRAILVWLNRTMLEGEVSYQAATVSNPMILKLLHDINNNLTQKITIDDLAKRHHLNRSYLMHLFKAETGSSIMKYISEKRLFLAKREIQNGVPVMEACFHCGFSNYTCFYKAFKARFGVSPKEVGNRKE